MELENDLEEDEINLVVPPQKKSRRESYGAERGDSVVQRLSPQSSAENVDGSQVTKRKTRSSSKPFNWSICLFCQQAKCHGVRKLFNVSTADSCKVIENAAEKRGDERLLRQIKGVDLIAAGARYHSSCRSQYVTVRSTNQSASNVEDVYVRAFDVLAREIEIEIISGKVLNMTSLLQRYRTKLENHGCMSAYTYRAEKLKRRLEHRFRNTIVFQKRRNPSQSEWVYSSAISVPDVLSKLAEAEKNDAYHQPASTEPVRNEDEFPTLYYAATIIRRSIKKDCKSVAIQPIDTDDLTTSKVRSSIPTTLYKFLQVLISSKDIVNETTQDPVGEEDDRRICAIAQDIIHATTRGRVKTPKHVALAMSVRHLTGSKQLVTMLNHFGHCSSYDITEIMDTSIANEIIAKSSQRGVVIPSNITPGPFIQIAADNNDLNEETLDGKGTTHATTMVLFQRKQYGPKPKQEVYGDHSHKKRSLSGNLLVESVLEFSAHGRRPAVETYRGKVQEKWYKWLNDPLRKMAIQTDFAWFLCRLNTTASVNNAVMYQCDGQLLPGWSAFNGRISIVSPPVTSVGYCPMINASSAEYSTIYTVMKNAQKMMASLQQKHSVITFDLAIYSKAKEIQWRQHEEFKDTILRLGGFHIALNYLAVIGKMFQDSGLHDIMVESEIYGSHAASVLLQGKSYNRGVRAHKIVLEGLLRMQWEAFLIWMARQGIQADAKYSQVAEACQQSFENNELGPNFQRLLDSTGPIQELFISFCEQGKKHSKLFHFWSIYIEMVMLLLRLIRAEREGVWSLHLNAVAEMIPYFSVMDRVNYARWLPVYIADMMLLPTLAPEVHKEFENGNHPVSRSKQPFSQVWTDMALEQTINLDSKTRGGIIGISLNHSALERWFLTGHERIAVTTATKQMCGIDDSSLTASHKESGKARKIRDEMDVHKVVTVIKESMVNPFKPTWEDEEPAPLLNIVTGVVMPPEKADQLLHAKQTGEARVEEFVSKRLDSNEIGFWDKVTKANVTTFASLSKKIKVRSAEEKEVTINADRSLFGRLLVVAKNRHIDLREVLSYEMSSVPYALAHPDGSLRKTTKSVLLAELESVSPSVGRLPRSNKEAALILDGMALLQSWRTAGCTTFGELALKLFEAITTTLRQENCSRVDVVFDRYDNPYSIKGGERENRGVSSALQIHINSGKTPIPKQWAKFMSNPVNKTSMVRFLCETWVKMGKSNLKPGERFFIGGGFCEPSDAVKIVHGNSMSLPELHADHEEADTRILLHAKHASITCGRLIIQSPDTDVAVLSVYFFSTLSGNELWFKTGTRDKLRYIPIHGVQDKLGRSVCDSLLGFHAVTGCDTTSGLASIGKKKALKALRSSTSLQEKLVTLGDDIPPTERTVESCEAFICSLYTSDRRAGTTADALRYWLFCQKKQKNERLPPTSDSLANHIKRANYQAHVWKKSLCNLQNLPSPDTNGWSIQEQHLKPTLMSKEPAPASVLELTICKCKRSACKSDNWCQCRANCLPCTEACLCMNDETCQNSFRLEGSDNEDDD